MSGSGKNVVLCADVDISCTFPKNNFSEMTTDPFSMCVGVAKPEFLAALYIKCNFSEDILVNWVLDLHFGRKNSYLEGKPIIAMDVMFWWETFLPLQGESVFIQLLEGKQVSSCNRISIKVINRSYVIE